SPAPVALRRRACLLMRNGKGDEVPFSWRDLRRFVGSYARPELPRRDAEEALEVVGELALVRETGVRGDLRQGHVRCFLEELLGPFDAAGDDILVRGQSGGPLELRDEVVGAEAGDRGQLLQGRATVEVLLDVLDDSAELRSGERAGSPARGLAGRQDVPDHVGRPGGGPRTRRERGPRAGRLARPPPPPRDA